MKIYAIFSNDNLNGTTYKLFKKSVETFKANGHEVDELLLYERAEEIPFIRHDQQLLEKYPFYIENKERFLSADVLLHVFPLVFFSVPGILKAWIDLINGWAYKYQTGINANPLHSIKKVIIIYSSMQYEEYLVNKLKNAVELQLFETFKFIGVPEIEFYLVDNVGSIDQIHLDEHLEKIEKLCKIDKN